MRKVSGGKGDVGGQVVLPVEHSARIPGGVAADGFTKNEILAGFHHDRGRRTGGDGAPQVDPECLRDLGVGVVIGIELVEMGELGGLGLAVPVEPETDRQVFEIDAKFVEGNRCVVRIVERDDRRVDHVDHVVVVWGRKVPVSASAPVPVGILGHQGELHLNLRYDRHEQHAAGGLGTHLVGLRSGVVFDRIVVRRDGGKDSLGAIDAGGLAIEGRVIKKLRPLGIRGLGQDGGVVVQPFGRIR